MTEARPVRFGGPASATGLVIVGLVCQEAGAAFAVLLFPSVGALGMVALRLTFSALLLLAIARPALIGRSRGDWMTVVGFGLTLALMNVVFYEALARIPLGAAVTIEVLGPLVLSVVASRRASSWLWAALAIGGVFLLGQGSFGDLDPVGVLFAIGAGAAWAGYILLSSRTGSRFARLDGLALAMALGAVLTLPFGVLTAGPAIVRPDIVLLGAAVAVLSSTIPYALELFALRRIPSSSFAVLMSLAPAMAALAGVVLLAQHVSVLGAVAIGLVVVASIGAVRSARPGPLPGARAET